MADDRFRFRCYRCNQLLAASSKKVAAVISCPKCNAELEVPRPDAEPAHVMTGPAEGGATSGPRQTERRAVPSERVPSLFADIAAAIPDDLAGLRPEDIRVEAEFADLVIDTSEGVQISSPAGRSETSSVESAPSLPDATIGAGRLDVNESASATAPSLDAGIAPVLPPIDIEPSTILPRDHPIRPVREVVLQPTTVLAWSLMVLMSIPMAFVAGLLIGHFVWK